MNQPLQELLETKDTPFICIYKNSKNEISTQEIFNASLNDSGNSKYIQGWSHKHRRPITLLADRVIKTFDDIDEADFFLQSFDQEQSHEVNLPKISRLSSPKTMDICFTGFPKEEKETLTKLAEENGMLVRKSVTKHLNILCFGENAGPVKLAQASFQGVIIVNRTQLEHLLATGEIPDALADDIKVKDTVPRKKTQNELVSEINKELTGLKEYSRRENLIAIFENNKAVGWKFHVTEFFKEMLDIKLTSVVINSQSFNSWTQGHSYSFKRGHVLFSHDSKDWKSFLSNKDAIVLQVRFDNPAGFVENQRIEGTFCGTYYSSKTILSSKEINNGDISVSSYIYDSGELVVDILKVKEDQTGVEKTDTIYLSQVDFVTLLQNGYYWKRPLDSDDDSTIEKITLIA